MKKRILFLCVANSARSQMAEGLAKNILDESFEVLSAGSGATHVHRLAIEVLKEIDIDILDQYSKSVDEFKGQDFDFVVTLCAQEVCPTYVGSKAVHLHWPLSDPSGGNTLEGQKNTFRRIRDELIQYIRKFKIEH